MNTYRSNTYQNEHVTDRPKETNEQKFENKTKPERYTALKGRQDAVTSIRECDIKLVELRTKTDTRRIVGLTVGWFFETRKQSRAWMEHVLQPTR